MQRIRQLRFGIAGTEIPKQRLGLLAQVLQIRVGGQRLRHDASMGPASARRASEVSVLGALRCGSDTQVA